MKRIYGKMPAEKVLELLERILIEFNIEWQKHIVSITCDGAPVMVKMGRLSGNDQQLCLAHGVHLAVVAVLCSKNRIPIYDEGTDEEPIGISQIQSTISDSYNDGLCGAEDTEGESIFSDEDDGEIDEDMFIPPLKINIETVIVKFRNIVRIFRKSSLKNEVLQSYIKEDLGKTSNLVMDCKTRWNSLVSMINRLLTVRKPLCKAMIDINLNMDVCELDWQVLENICSCLKPIEMGISALCQRDANLLSAEGIFYFMIQKLEMIREDPCIKRKEVQKTMKMILSQLYSQDGTEQFDSVILNSQETSEDIEDVEIRSFPILLDDQLKRAIQNSTTHVRTPKEDIGFLSLIKEMALFEATGDKSKNISSIEEVLNTIPLTSVEAERAFSAAGLVDGTEQFDSVILNSQETSEDIEDVEIRSFPILLDDQLKRAIQNSTTHVRTPKEDIGFLSLIKEMALFEATGDKSKNISSIEEVLNTIPLTSVEAERAFSAAGLVVTKLRSRLIA
ncbi:hypothetical protein LOD99_3915 [Oopsacas minuta]|uniref:HAT C-terminal dimerisation domain-containing protein n=1 Tax=Oopsacas minuta TaxID=111878 RepID=A0AAV7JX44_9METZ|nr:hypothetical protein LOD99_3915 [Oopsacas minuta]